MHELKRRHLAGAFCGAVLLFATVLATWLCCDHASSADFVLNALFIVPSVVVVVLLAAGVGSLLEMRRREKWSILEALIEEKEKMHRALYRCNDPAALLLCVVAGVDVFRCMSALPARHRGCADGCMAAALLSGFAGGSVFLSRRKTLC